MVPEHALGISVKVVRGVMRGWTSRKHENMRSIGSPLICKGRLRAFLKDPLLKELGSFST
jgi:hypothetical protein